MTPDTTLASPAAVVNDSPGTVGQLPADGARFFQSVEFADAAFSRPRAGRVHSCEFAPYRSLVEFGRHRGASTGSTMPWSEREELKSLDPPH
jgi:hypothetical protein